MIFRRTKKPKSLSNLEELLPPEGVPLKLQIASVGVRFAAQLTDLLITLVAAIAILILFATLELTTPQTWIAIASMLFFITRIPYYVLSEIVWNGQTLGKRLMKIKVVSNDGMSLSVHALVVRNLLKEAEIFLPGTLLLTLDSATPVASLLAFAWIIAALMVPLFNKRRRRLGDFIAGTYVIHLPVPVLLQDLSQVKPAKFDNKQAFNFLSHNLDHYGAFELQTLEDYLRRLDRPQSPELMRSQHATTVKVVENIRRKIDYADKVPAIDNIRFLRAFYNAQRGYLEQRQLFGEKRADKFHTGPDEPS